MNQMQNKDIEDLFIKILSGKKIFLTGGTGFFGKSLLDLLIKSSVLNDTHFTILSRSPDDFKRKYPEYLHRNINFHRGDIENFDFPNETFDYIFHFATPADARLNVNEPLTMAKNVVVGMQRALDFAVHCKAKKFLFSSSGAVYGKQPEDITHVPESYLGAPLTYAKGSAYGEAKRYAEFLGCEYSRIHGFDFLIARCFAFVGRHLDRQRPFAIGNFLEDLKNKREIKLTGDGTSLRSYLYADDLIFWLFKLMEKGKSCEPYNIGSDEEISIKDLAIRMCSLIGSESRPVVNTAAAASKVERYVPSIEKAKSELGVSVWTTLDESIIKTFEKI